MKAIRFRGDATSAINIDDKDETIADAEAKTWKDVVNYIEFIDSTQKLYINEKN